MTLDLNGTCRRGDFTLQLELSLPRGQTIAVLGPNGAGKSTLVDLLCGVCRLATGQLTCGGQWWDAPANGKFVATNQRRIGVVFQQPRLFPNLSVQDNVAFGLKAQGQTWLTARNNSRSWLERFELVEIATQPARTLSGGQAQRVALARAFACNPELLVLDEPLTALDVAARASVARTLQTALDAFDGCKLLITHVPLEALTLAQQLLILEQGQAVQFGTPEELCARPRSSYAAAFVGLNLWPGTVEPAGDGFCVRVGNVTLQVIGAGLQPQQPVWVTFHPRAVTIALTRPSGSARNVLAGRLRELSFEGERARLTLATEPAVVAEITTRSVLDLQLVAGQELWAAIKATEIEVYPR